MKTFAQHLQDLQATRKAKEDAQTAVARKGVDEGRSLNTAEQAEFDALETEIKSLDADIARTSTMAAREKASATPVTETNSNLPAVGGAAASAPVQVKNTQKLEPGIGFARVARVKALSHLQHLDPLQIAKSIYPGDDVLVNALNTKAAVDAANTLSATWAGNLINEGGIAFADFVEYLRPRTLVGRVADRMRRLPFDTPVLIQSSGGAAKWVKEGFAKPLTEWTYTRAKLSPLKVAVIAAVTKETLMRASVATDALIRDELARAVGATLDTTFISDAAAVADESPAGILNGTAALTLVGGGDEAAVRCDVAAFLNAFVTNNLSLEGAFWVMPERVAIALSLMVNPLGQSAFPGVGFSGGTFFGLPVFVTNYANTSSAGSVVALIKGDEIFLGDEGGIQVAMSDQASLQMDNAPTQNSAGTPVATQVVSMFQTNSVAFLVERFMNWQKRRAQAVAWARVDWDVCA